MSHLAGRLAALGLLAVLAVALAGCGSATSPGPAITRVDAGTAVSMLQARTVIDVRSPAEYAAGHIAGARNIDVEGADFATRIATLDKGAAYLVYCHSGRRSTLAAEQMAAAGFSDIVDGGAMAALIAAGAPAE
jgi:phage shock protein E